MTAAVDSGMNRCASSESEQRRPSAVIERRETSSSSPRSVQRTARAQPPHLPSGARVRSAWLCTRSTS
jgi:hypothetical protein